MKKLTLFFIALVVNTFCIIAQTPVPGGPVSGIWDTTGSPYMINGEISILPGTSLTIEPGVEVKFTGWYKFIVEGSLIAEGTETDSIVFTAADTNTCWHGIRFFNSSGTSSLSYCIVEYGLTILNQYTQPDNCGGGIMCYFSLGDINISHSTIRNNHAYYGGGIEVWASSPVIQHCHITNNIAEGSGGGMENYEVAAPVIMNCLIANNSAPNYNGGGMMFTNGCTPQIIECKIINNSCFDQGGGIRFSSNNTDFLVERTLIANNYAGQRGGGLYIQEINGTFLNNTIVENTSGYVGGGICFAYSCASVFRNTIIYFNEAYSAAHGNQIYLNHDESDPHFLYCDIEGGIENIAGPGSGINYQGDTTGTISADPLLDGSYCLCWTSFPYVDPTRSPCIDNGDPQFIYNDPDMTRNDMGAYYFDQMPETPVAYDPPSQTPTSFIADWSSCYGASGYVLDVALDEDFTNFVQGYENLELDDTTSWHDVTGLEGGDYYYRVKSCNAACTGQYSDTIYVYIPPPQAISEPFNPEYEVYILDNQIHINIPGQSRSGDYMLIYSYSGQLIAQKPLQGGMNFIAPGTGSQVVILRIVLNGKIYSKKLLLR